MIRRALCVSFCVMAATLIVRTQCPQLSITSPSDVQEGQPVTFFVDVTGGDRNVEKTYNWTISAGTISSGQGTAFISVDTTGVGGYSATATVDVGGYDRRCQTSRSATTYIEKLLSARKFDEYGALALKDEKPRLDNFAIELQNDPMAQAYVIAYGGRRTARGTAAARIKTAKTHLIGTRGIASDRVVTIDGGYREEPTTELWIVPQGAELPQASPTSTRRRSRRLSKRNRCRRKPQQRREPDFVWNDAEPPEPTPTIKRSEIVYPNTRPERKPQPRAGRRRTPSRQSVVNQVIRPAAPPGAKHRCRYADRASEERQEKMSLLRSSTTRCVALVLQTSGA